LEIADVFAVNKADRDGADDVVRELKRMISLGRQDKRGPSWRQPIVRTVASREQGRDELLAALDEHQAWLAEHGELERRRLARAEAEVVALALERLRAQLDDLGGGQTLRRFAEQVLAGELAPHAAAAALVAEARGEKSIDVAHG
jgi:LAO/AO transport system kinase